MSVPQRLTYVTLGARNMAALRAFYRHLGWTERPGSDDAFATYDMGPILLALYPLDLLTREAAPGEEPSGGQWAGVTFGINVDSSDAVDDAFDAAVRAGARPVAAPTRREWGGYSAYVADPEGNRWEITWAPGA